MFCFLCLGFMVQGLVEGLGSVVHSFFFFFWGGGVDKKTLQA